MNVKPVSVTEIEEILVGGYIVNIFLFGKHLGNARGTIIFER